MNIELETLGRLQAIASKQFSSKNLPRSKRVLAVDSIDSAQSKKVLSFSPPQWIPHSLRSESVKDKTPLFNQKPPFRCYGSTRALEALKKTKQLDQIIAEFPKQSFRPVEKELSKILQANFFLTLEGRLLKGKNGSYVLKIEESLYQQLRQLFGITHLPYPDFPRDIGAHSVLILPEEDVHGYVSEVGKLISFKIKRIFCFEPYEWNEAIQACVMTIESNQITEFRRNHRLSDRISGQDFHCILGALTTRSTRKKPPQYIAKINPAIAFA